MSPQLVITQSILFSIINAQTIYINTPASWTDAKLDCINRGSTLLTAQGNTADITECINTANTNSTTAVWIGLNRLDQSDWDWTADDITYDATTVNWASNAPAGPAQSDCAELRTSGARTSEITNRQITCSDLKSYCCNPVSSAPSTPTTSTTPSPTADTSSPTTSPTASCSRVRKEWNTASKAERDLYINALLTLSSQGKLQKFTQQHAENAASNQAHSTSAFLTWHRLFLYELEEQIRSLGGEYECFALLYWNWGKDVADYGYRFSRYSVTKYGLGATGDAADNYCVKDGSFAYTGTNGYTPYYCGYKSANGQCYV